MKKLKGQTRITEKDLKDMLYKLVMYHKGGNA